MQQGDDDGNNTDTDYPSPDDDDINGNNITVSLNADDNVGANKDINEQLVTNNDDSNGRNTDTDHNLPGKQKSILILGMSTVDVQETLKNLGNTVVVDKTLVLTAEQCVIKKLFLQQMVEIWQESIPSKLTEALKSTLFH